MKKTLYVDMDNVLVSFSSGIDQLDGETVLEYENHLDDVPHIFSLMEPMDGAIDAYEQLCQKYDTYILSTAPWNNPSAWMDKAVWVRKYLPKHAHKRLIITHHKNLVQGDYLIDDRIKNGVELFAGEHIHFGTTQFPDWQAVLDYLLPKA